MKKRPLLILFTTLALMGVTAGVLTRVGKSHKLGRPGVKTSPLPGSRNLQIYLPEKVLDYKSEPMPIAAIVTNTLPRDTSIGQRFYKSPEGLQLLMNVVLMGSDRTSIHKPQICLTGWGWKITRTEPFELPMTRPHPYRLPVMKLTATRRVTKADGRDAELRGVYVYWFVSADRITAEHGQRMWWMAKELLQTGVLERWAYVAVFGVCEPGKEDAVYERMTRFIQDATPQFQLVAGPAESGGGASAAP